MHRDVKLFDKDYICFNNDGEVVNQNHVSHTSSTTGPGRTTYTQVPGTAVVVPQHVKGETVVNTSHEYYFWAKFSDGSEAKYTFNHSPNVREGHKVRIYCLMHKGANSGFGFYMKNLTTNEYTDMQSYSNLNKRLEVYEDKSGGAGLLGGFYAIFLIFVAPIIGVVTQSVGAFIFAEIIGLGVFLTLFSVLSECEKKFTESMDELKSRLRAET